MEKLLYSGGPGRGKEEWKRQPLDGHAHDWSGWAAIWRNGYEICLECGINELELWEMTHAKETNQEQDAEACEDQD